MPNASLADRFKPGSIVAGAWLTARYNHCEHSGSFVFSRVKVIDGIKGHADAIAVNPLDLWYCTDMGEAYPVWLSQGEGRAQDNPNSIRSEKEQSIRHALESCQPYEDLPMETNLATFLSTFSRGCQFVMNDSYLIKGIIRRGKNAVETITKKFPIDKDALRRDTNMAFRDCQANGAEGMGRASRIITRASRKFKIN